MCNGGRVAVAVVSVCVACQASPPALQDAAAGDRGAIDAVQPDVEPPPAVGGCGDGVIDTAQGEQCEGRAEHACPEGSWGRAFCGRDCRIDHSACGGTAVTYLHGIGDAPCAALADGRLVCWGRNWRDAAASPFGGAIAHLDFGGVGHVATVGKLGQIADNTRFFLRGEGFREVQLGSALCGLHAAGQVICDDGGDEPYVLAGPFEQLFGRGWHFCATAAQGPALCWTMSASQPSRAVLWTDVPSLGHPTDIAFIDGNKAGACAIYAAQPSICFGEPLPAHLVPPAVPLARLGFASNRGAYGCGLRAGDGRLTCWGEAATTRHPIFGGGPLLPGEDPLFPPAGTFKDLAMAKSNCATDGQDIVCWGGYGQYPVGPQQLALDIERLAPDVAGFAVVAQNAADQVVTVVLGPAPADPQVMFEQRPAIRRIVGDELHKHGLSEAGNLLQWGRNRYSPPSSAQGFSDLAAFFDGRVCALDSGALRCAGSWKPPDALPPLSRLALQTSPWAPICGVSSDERSLCLDGDAIRTYAQPGAYSTAQSVFDPAGGSPMFCGVGEARLTCHDVKSGAVLREVDLTGRRSPVVYGEGTTCFLDAAGTKTCEPHHDGLIGTPVPKAQLDRGCDLTVDGAVDCFNAPPAPHRLRGGVRVFATSLGPDRGGDRWCVGWADGVVRCTFGKADFELEETVDADSLQVNYFGTCHLGGTRLRCDIPHPDWHDKPPAVDVKQFAVGWLSVCAVLADGTLRCWESDAPPDFGELPGERFVRVGVGKHDVCAETEAQQLRCWTRPSLERPALALDLAGATEQIEVGDGFVCVRYADGRVDCATDGQREVTPPEASFTKIAAGHDHVCGLVAGGAIRCFGGDRFGKRDPYGVTLHPTAAGYVDIASGAGFSCAVAPEMPLRCWGKIWYE